MERVREWLAPRRVALASNDKFVGCVALFVRTIDPLVSSQGGALLLVLSLSFAFIHTIALWIVSGGLTFEWRDPSPVRTFLPIAVAFIGCAVQFVPVILAAVRITIDIRCRHPRFLSVFSLSVALVVAFASLHLFVYLVAETDGTTYALAKAAAGATQSSAVALERTVLNLPRAFITLLHLSAATQTFTGYGDVAPDSLGGNFCTALQMGCGVLISLALKEQAIFLAWRSRRPQQTQAVQRQARAMHPHAEEEAERAAESSALGASGTASLRAAVAACKWAYAVVAAGARRWLVAAVAALQLCSVACLATSSLLAPSDAQPSEVACVTAYDSLLGKTTNDEGARGGVTSALCACAALLLELASLALVLTASVRLVQPRVAATTRYAVRVFVATTLTVRHRRQSARHPRVVLRAPPAVAARLRVFGLLSFTLPRHSFPPTVRWHLCHTERISVPSCVRASVDDGGEYRAGQLRRRGGA